MRRRPAPLEQPRRTTDQRTSTYRENATRPGRLLPDPSQHFSVLHKGFLAESTGHMKHVELWCTRQRRIRRQPQPFEVAHGLSGLAVERFDRIRVARAGWRIVYDGSVRGGLEALEKSF